MCRIKKVKQWIQISSITIIWMIISTKNMTTHLFRKLILALNVSNTNESLYFNEDDFNKNFNNSNNLSFIHINICTVPKNFKKFELFLSNLKHEFQIICCSESRLKNSTKNRYTPKGFTHVFDYREKKRGGGTSIFINDSVQYEKRKDLKLDLHSDYEFMFYRTR